MQSLVSPGIFEGLNVLPPHGAWVTEASDNAVLTKVNSYIANYPGLRTVKSASHFTPWQTCSVTHKSSLIYMT